MKIANYLQILFWTFCFYTVVCVAQVPQATPTPQITAEETVVINTAHIQIDVTVVDKKGKTIKELRSDDFEIFENGEKQAISSFSFIEKLRSVDKSKAPQQSVNQTNNTGQGPTADKVRKAYALVIDDLNLSMEGVNLVKIALRKFIDAQMEDGDLVAILRTGGGTNSLLHFTTDRKILLEAVDKLRWKSSGTGSVTAFPPIEPTFADMMKSSNPDMSAGSYEAALGREREKENLRNSLFANISLMAINFMVNSMKELPGRKSIMLFSEGFAQVQFDRNKFPETADSVDNAIKLLIDTANRNSVVIYTMDARGPVSMEFGPIDNTGSQSRSRVRQRLEERNFRLGETQGVLREIANETGGFAITNSVDINEGLGKMLNDQGSYYLIGYEPDSDTFDEKTRRFNKLTIKVKNPDYQVRFRSGFFNVAATQTKVDSIKPVTTSSQRLSDAIMSPFAVNDVRLTMNTVFTHDQKSGNLLRAFLHIDAADLGFNDAQGGQSSSNIDLMAVVFDSNGNKIDEISKSQILTVPTASLEKIHKKGIAFDLPFSIGKPGDYKIRVAIRDHKKDKFGSVNQIVSVPSLNNGKLDVSGIVFENFSFDDWQKEIRGEKVEKATVRDTAVRRFVKNSVLSYGLEIYNAKLDPAKKHNLQILVRILQDDKIIHEGKPQRIPPDENSITTIAASGAFLIDDQFKAGNYVLQLSVTDSISNQTVNKIVAFSVIE